MEKQSLQKNEEFRIEIREKMRRDRLNRQRSQTFKAIELKEEEIAILRSTINEKNFGEYLKQLKYLSMNAKALNDYVWLARSLVELARQTKCKYLCQSEQYIFEDAMTVLCNMVACESFKLQDKQALELSEFLIVPEKQMVMFELFTNILSKMIIDVDLSAPQLFKSLVDKNLLTFLESRSQKVFENQGEITIFCDFLIACLVYSHLLNTQQLERLIVCINKNFQKISQLGAEFSLCISLSRCSQEFNIERALVLLRGFKHIILDILAKKKTRPIMALQPFLNQFVHHEKAYQILKQQGIIEGFALAMQSRNPQTKQIIITLMANMIGAKQAMSDVIFTSLFDLIRIFERQELPVQLALGYFMAVNLNQSQDLSILSVLHSYGLVMHIRTLLQTEQNVESINTGLLLLNSTLRLQTQIAVECEQIGIVVLLERLQQHPSSDIHSKSLTLLDTYFKS